MQYRWICFFLPILAIVCTLQTPASARSDTRVKGYQRKSRATIPAYRRKPPNKNRLDNYETKGNFNPATGKAGEERSVI